MKNTNKSLFEILVLITLQNCYEEIKMQQDVIYNFFYFKKVFGKKKGFTHKGLTHKALTVLKTRILVLKKLKTDWSKFGIITVLIKIISPPMGVKIPILSF
jgi:hypothetical protein